MPTNGHLNGGMVITEAPISPGESGDIVIVIRPFLEEAWKYLKPGNQITMHEGARLVGVAILK